MTPSTRTTYAVTRIAGTLLAIEAKEILSVEVEDEEALDLGEVFGLTPVSGSDVRVLRVSEGGGEVALKVGGLTLEEVEDGARGPAPSFLSPLMTRLGISGLLELEAGDDEDTGPAARRSLAFVIDIGAALRGRAGRQESGA